MSYGGNSDWMTLPNQFVRDSFNRNMERQGPALNGFGVSGNSAYSSRMDHSFNSFSSQKTNKKETEEGTFGQRDILSDIWKGLHELPTGSNQFDPPLWAAFRDIGI